MQCDEGDGTCNEMRNELGLKGMERAERANDFKYVFDVGYDALIKGLTEQVDGNAWSSRFQRLMMGNKSVPASLSCV